MVTLIALTVFAAVQGKKWKSCERRIQRFERCLERGYKSKAGCVSGEGELEGYRARRRCRKLEKKIAKKCDYVCEKEPVLIPEECQLSSTKLVGTEVRSLQPSTFEDCRVQCSYDPDCEAFNSDDSKCQLLTDVTRMDRTWGTTVMIKGCDRSELDMNCAEENTEYRHDDGKTLQSYIIGYPDANNIEECAKVCRDFKICKSVSYAYYEYSEESVCRLYNAAPGEEETDLKKVDSTVFTSMTMDCDAI